MAVRYPYLLFSLVLGYGLAAFLARLAPQQMSAHTDVVGFPLVNNFNVNSFILRLYLPMLVGPFASFYIFDSIRRYLGETAMSRPFIISQRIRFFLARALRWSAFGGVLGFAVLVGGRSTFPKNPASFVLGVALAYTAGLWALGLALSKIFRIESEVVYSSLNTSAFLLSPMALWLVSRRTGVVLPNGSTIHYAWFPLALSLLWIFSLILYARAKIKRRPTLWGVLYLEIKLFYLVLVPVALFLLTAYLCSPSLTLSDYFHLGERLVSADLIRQGFFPWRDVLFIHGLWEDPLRYLIGMKWYGHDLWGANLAETLLFIPLFGISLYFIFLTLFRRNPWFLLGITFVLPFSVPTFFSFTKVLLIDRFLFNGALIVLLFWMLKRPRIGRAVVFSAVLLGNTIISPESSYFTLAAAVVVLFHDWELYKKTRKFSESFLLSSACLVTGLVGAGLFVLYLFRHDALQPFLNYYRIFAKDHRYSGALPLAHQDTMMVLFAYIPLLVFLPCAWYATSKLRSKKPFTVGELTAGVLCLFSVLYYQKFLSRADHGQQVYAVAIPIVFYVLYRCFGHWEQLFRRTELGSYCYQNVTRYPLTAFCFLSVAAVSPTGLLKQINQTDERLRPVMTAPPETRVGRFMALSPEENRVIDEFSRFFAKNLNPEDRIFDFTNAPLLFHYALHRLPATRYFHVSMAIPKLAQQDLISELEKAKPKLVIFSNQVSYLYAWDRVSNMVRHYDVSHYLLTHYKPVANLSTFVVMMRNDLVKRSVFQESDYFASGKCEWGTVPHFWSEPWSQLPRLTSNSAPVTFHSTASPAGGVVTKIQFPHSMIGKRRYLDIYFNRVSRGEFALNQDGSNPSATNRNRAISFFSLPNGKVRYRISVGSCSQWYAFRGNTLYLWHEFPQEIAGMELSDA